MIHNYTVFLINDGWLQIFDLFDTDKSGEIDAKECKSALGQLYEAIGEPADDVKLTKDSAVSYCRLSAFLILR